MSLQELKLQHALKLLAKGTRNILYLENKTYNSGFRSEPYQADNNMMNLSHFVALNFQ